jgi:glutathione synthase
VLVTWRRVLGVVDRVIPLGGAGLHHVTPGGPLTATQTRVVGEVLAFMRARGIVVAGLDFIGDTLTEINVSCPGAIPEVNMFCGITAEDMIVEDLRAMPA